MILIILNCTGTVTVASFLDPFLALPLLWDLNLAYNKVGKLVQCTAHSTCRKWAWFKQEVGVVAKISDAILEPPF